MHYVVQIYAKFPYIHFLICSGLHQDKLLEATPLCLIMKEEWQIHIVPVSGVTQYTLTDGTQ